MYLKIEYLKYFITNGMPFEFDLVQEKKEEIEKFVLNQDWNDVAETLWRKRDEWLELEFFAQTKWRTDYFGLSPEKFKDVIWENK